MLSKKSAFFVDNYGNIGIGTQKPRCTLDLYNTTDGILLPRNNTAWSYATLPSSNAGLRYNPASKYVEVLEHSQWSPLISIVNKPIITNVSTTQMIHTNSTLELYGSNFRPNMQVTFIGNDRRIVAPSIVTYCNETWLSIKRSEYMPTTSSPYRIRLYDNVSGLDTLSPMTITSGILPVFTTTSNAFGPLYISSNYPSIGWITCTDDTGGAICNMSIYPPNALSGSGINASFTSSGNTGILTLSGTISMPTPFLQVGGGSNTITVCNFRVKAIDSGSNEAYSDIFPISIQLLVLKYPPIILTGLANNVNPLSFTISNQSYGNGEYIITASSSASLGLPFDDTNTTYYIAGGPYTYPTGVYVGNTTTTVSGTNYLGEWYQVKLPNAIMLQRYGIGAVDRNYSADSWVIAGSSNGINWILLDDRPAGTGVNTLVSFATTLYTVSTVSGPYNYIRMISRATIAQNQWALGTYELYG